jgi:hypothetical protein
LHRWLKIADREDGVDSAGPRADLDDARQIHGQRPRAYGRIGHAGPGHKR